MFRSTGMRWLLASLVMCGAAARAGAEGSVTWGSQWWDQTANDANYQTFREVPRGGFLRDFVLREWNGRDYWALSGVNALRRDQNTTLTLARGGRYWLDVGYQQIPHLYSQVARSPYVETSAGVFSLPDSLQALNQRNSGAYARTMTDLLRNAGGEDMLLMTDISRARLRARAGTDWSFDVRATHRQRTGQKPWGTSLGFSDAIEIAEPVDQRTTDVDGVVDYRRTVPRLGPVNLEASGGVSVFDNHVETLRWDSPRRLTDAASGAATGQMALYPSNQSVRGALALGLSLPRRSLLTGTVSMAQNTQNEDWLPFTVNSTVAQRDSLPGKSPDAKATILVQDYRLTTRALSAVTPTLRFHQYRYQNDTGPFTFAGIVPYDGSWTPGPNETVAYGQTWSTLGADADASPVHGVTVGATYEYLDRKHEDREVEEDTENAVAGRLHARSSAGLALDAKYRHGKREPKDFLKDDYLDPTGTAYEEQPGLRRFDVADRTQDDATVGASYALGEQLDLSLSWRWLHNDYAVTDTVLGLRDEAQHLVTAEAAWHASDKVDVTGGLGIGRTETRQRSRQSASSAVNMADSVTWNADLTDKSTYGYVNAQWLASPKVTVLAGFEGSRSMGEFGLTNATHTAQSLPNQFYRRLDATGEVRYRCNARTEVAGQYAWEQFDVNDFAAQNIPYVFPTVGSVTGIFLGTNLQSYRAHRVAAVVRYSF